MRVLFGLATFSVIVLLFFRDAGAYFLMGANNILTTQRLDPVVSPGTVSTHVHTVVGGSNFGIDVTTGSLKQSTCTSVPINEDKSAYWFPHLYFQANNGSFFSVSGSVVIYYLFSDNSTLTTPFPDDFRMISGDPTLRTLDPSSFAQQAITFLCLDFNGKSTRFNELPVRQSCPQGIRSQINFPSCWDGQKSDSSDHKSHVAFLSTGPDNGTCSDPAYPVTLPRIFMEVYWITQAFDDIRDEAMTPSQPFVFSNGDPTGYGYHADFIMGWEDGVLQRVINECNCNPFGDPTCCVAKGTISFQQQTQCFVTETVDETVLGNLSVLPGANPVQAPCFEQYAANYTPALLSPTAAYTVDTHATSTQTAPAEGTVSVPATTVQLAQTAVGTCIRQGGAPRTLSGKELWRTLLILMALAHWLGTVM